MTFPMTFQEVKWIQTVLFVANEAGSLSIPPSYDGLGIKDPISSMQFIRYCCGISWRGGRGVCTGNSNFTDIEVYVYTLLLSWGVCCYYEAAKITSFQLYFSLEDSIKGKLIYFNSLWQQILMIVWRWIGQLNKWWI